MYNGIGLQTPRGSGTNGYVARNMSFVHKSKEKVNYKTEEDIKKLDALANRKPNQGILAHERKRTIELKCLEMQELMEEQGYPDDVIDGKVALFREMLIEKEGVGGKEIPKDEFGRPIVKESHQLAEANQEKNSKMRDALGISPFFVEGSSLDPERRNKEAAAAAAEEAKRKYEIIPDSSSSSSPERSQEKEKNKKRKKKKSPIMHEKGEPSNKKKKSLKKRKKEQSDSLGVHKKRKNKKIGKEKSKYQSKNDANRKKHARSSSSSASTSDSADDASSSRSSSRNSNSDSDTSQDKHKSTLKHDKGHKGHRKRSTSSEKIRYAKDARSRKDIYEAKKAKYKKKSCSSSSSSSAESPPRQYYRLEPVLVKSKSKHKAPCQIFEIPKKSAIELMKYERKKRKYQNSSSSSSDEENGKQGGKRRKRSETPVPSKVSKHSTGRDQEGISGKQTDSHKSLRRSEKGSQSAMPEKNRRNRSRSGESGGQRKPQNHKLRSNHEEYSDDNQRHMKQHFTGEDEKHHEKERNRKKLSRKETETSKYQNGYSKHAPRSETPDTEDTDRSSRCGSVHKHKKYISRSPSQSPGTYKHKKHVIASPSYLHPDSHKKKVIPRSPSYSPPKKPISKHHQYQKSTSDSCPVKKPGRHDSESRSRSPALPDLSRKGKEIAKKSTAKCSTRPVRNPSKERENSESRSRSTSLQRKPNVRVKHRSTNPDKSSCGSHVLDRSDNHYVEKAHVSKGWKSKGEIKEIGRRSQSSSPVHHKEHHSKQRKDKTYTDHSSPPESKMSPKAKPGMTVTVETCQVTSTRSALNPTLWNRDSSSHSPDRLPSIDELKKMKQNRDIGKQRTKDIANKTSPTWFKEDNSSPKKDDKFKSKHGNSTDTNTGTVSALDNHKDDYVTAKKSNWSLVSNGENGNDVIAENLSITESPAPKMQSKSKCNENASLSTRVDENCIKSEKESVFRGAGGKSGNSPEFSRSRSRSASKNPDLEKSAKNKDRTLDESRSRSRSTSMARSCSQSGSERSSRSRSYSRRDSRSRSKSYSKSRSRSHSHSRSRSRSKSYSRSRSISIYSRSRSRSYSSRSRSRSNARSPSIPRRRGSPSFLDKRRITS